MSDIAQPSAQTCGIVMPISSIDGCDEAHWSDVLSIVQDAIEEAGFSPNLVSNADEVGIIQKRIIQNLYDNPIVVCDVSGKNPNVMFELGLRLAFDKPTIVIKDDKTSYSFDTSPIEHISYPRDLRFSQIVVFKDKLIDKIVATHRASTSDRSYTTFLKSFGDFKIVKLDEKEVTEQQYLFDELRMLRRDVSRLIPRNGQARPAATITGRSYCLRNKTVIEVTDIINSIRKLAGPKAARLEERSPGHFHIKLMNNYISESVKGDVEEIMESNVYRGKEVEEAMRNSENEA